MEEKNGENKTQLLTNCKLHCEGSAMSYFGFSHERPFLPDADAHRNPQRQLTSDR